MTTFILAISLFIVFLVVVFYSRKTLSAELSNPVRWALILLRTGFLILVFWLSFKPSFKKQEQIAVPNKATILVDDTHSMNLDIENASVPFSRWNHTREVVFSKPYLEDS